MSVQSKINQTLSVAQQLLTGRFVGRYSAEQAQRKSRAATIGLGKSLVEPGNTAEYATSYQTISAGLEGAKKLYAETSDPSALGEWQMFEMLKGNLEKSPYSPAAQEAAKKAKEAQLAEQQRIRGGILEGVYTTDPALTQFQFKKPKGGNQ